MSLRIEELTQQVEMTKTAEEEVMEKIAETVNVLEQAQALSIIGEDLCKFAEESGIEVMGYLGADLFDVASRMGAALTKTAAEGDYALVDSLNIAEDLNKIASLMAEIGDETQDEEFCKIAEVVINISNEMTEDANEVIEKMAMYDPTQPSGEPLPKKYQNLIDSSQDKTPKGMPLDPAERTADQTTLKGWRARLAGGRSAVNRAFKATAARGEWNSKAGETFMNKLKHMVGTKAGLKALAPAVAAYGGSAAIAGGLGYAAYRHHKNK